MFHIARIGLPLIGAVVIFLLGPADAQTPDIALTICNDADATLHGLFLRHGDHAQSVADSGDLAAHQCATIRGVSPGSNALQYFQSGGPLCTSEIEITGSQRFVIGPDTKASCIK